MASTTRYILPIADLIVSYREDISCLTDLHLDWDMTAQFLVQCIQSPQAMSAQRDIDHDCSPNSQDEIEFRAICKLLDGLKVRLYEIGFWTTTHLCGITLAGWMCDDLVVDIHYP